MTKVSHGLPRSTTRIDISQLFSKEPYKWVSHRGIYWGYRDDRKENGSYYITVENHFKLFCSSELS